MTTTTVSTHRDWDGEFARVLALSETAPAKAGAACARLLKRVERAMADGINDWHLVQTWHQMSLIQARAGQQAEAAHTLLDMAEHHRVLADEHRRAEVAAAATAAVHLAKAGDLPAARKVLRDAGRRAAGLSPKEPLLGLAAKYVARHGPKRSC